MAQFVFPPQSIDTTGLATEATQLLNEAHLAAIEVSTDNIDVSTASIDTKTPALGQATMANSSPVVIASDQSAVPVTGPLTDAELRATPVDVLGPLTDTELRATPVPVSGPLTDTQLRATPVDVLGPLTDVELRATPVDVLGPLTDTELRATPVPISGTVAVTATDLDIRDLNSATDSVTVVATNLDIRDLTSVSDSVSAVQSGAWAVAVNNFPATQPVSGTVAVTQSTSPWIVDGSAVTQPVSAASLPLPTGASTSALQTTGNSSLSSIDGKVPANLTVTATRLLVDGSGVTQPVSGTVTATATDLDIRDLTSASDSVEVLQSTHDDLNLNANIQVGDADVANGNPVPVSDAGSSLTVDAVNLDIRDLTSVSDSVSAVQSGTWTIQPGNTANTTAWLVKEQRSSTATLSNVASSASSVTLLSSNANRLNATIFNDSTQVLYVKFGATASATSYTVQIAANGYYELPVSNIYTGIIDGIWASANGNARVTELT